MVAGVEQYLGRRPGCHQDQKEGKKNETKARSQAPRQDAEEEAAIQGVRRMRCEAWSKDDFAPTSHRTGGIDGRRTFDAPTDRRVARGYGTDALVALEVV